MSTIQETDKAWIAGFMDGEGSFVVKPNNSKLKRPGFFPRISIGNTDKESLEYLSLLYGGTVNLHKPANEKRKQVYQWYCPKATMLVFLSHTVPYLRVKKEPALLLLEFLHLKLGHGGLRMSDEDWGIRNEIFLKLRYLNK